MRADTQPLIKAAQSCSRGSGSHVNSIYLMSHCMHVVQMRLHHDNAGPCARLGTRGWGRWGGGGLGVARLIILAFAVFVRATFHLKVLCQFRERVRSREPASEQLPGCELRPPEPRGKTLQEKTRKKEKKRKEKRQFQPAGLLTAAEVM